ncbi:hypothetical protein DB345_02290 [Spartobacteria bacterium LR76]|nr:hypothetical protein DB345_02290 [Spartobacteria bacterium LR76]
MKFPLVLGLLCVVAASVWADQPRKVVKPPPVVKVLIMSGKTKVADFKVRADGLNATAGCASFSALRNRMVPTEWDLPMKVRGSDGAVGYVPATPSVFELRPLGLTVRAVAELKKGLVVLNCEITQAEGRKLPTLYGEGVDQVDTGDGRVVKFRKREGDAGTVTSETSFQLYAKPGKTYTIPVLFGGKTVNWRVTCTVEQP